MTKNKQRKPRKNQGESLQMQRKVRKCWKANEKLRKATGKQQKIKKMKENQ